MGASSSTDDMRTLHAMAQLRELQPMLGDDDDVVDDEKSVGAAAATFIYFRSATCKGIPYTT
jgi:hypothetical protein